MHRMYNKWRGSKKDHYLSFTKGYFNDRFNLKQKKELKESTKGKREADEVYSSEITTAEFLEDVF